MRGHNIRFHLEIRKNIFKLSSVPILSGALSIAQFGKLYSTVTVIFSSPGQNLGRAVLLTTPGVGGGVGVSKMLKFLR